MERIDGLIEKAKKNAITDLLKPYIIANLCNPLSKIFVPGYDRWLIVQILSQEESKTCQS